MFCMHPKASWNTFLPFSNFYYSWVIGSSVVAYAEWRSVYLWYYFSGNKVPQSRFKPWPLGHLGQLKQNVIPFKIFSGPSSGNQCPVWRNFIYKSFEIFEWDCSDAKKICWRCSISFLPTRANIFQSESFGIFLVFDDWFDFWLWETFIVS